jgi:hypothetical protein
LINPVQLVIHSPDPQECTQLQHLLRGSKDLILFNGSAQQTMKQCDVDAVFVTGMHITYWGAGPFFTNHSEVLQTPKEKLALGLPELFVAAMLQADNDPATHGLRYAKLMLEAVDRYNENHSERPIHRIASIPDFLALKGENSAATAQMLVSLFKERNSWFASANAEARLSA